MRRATVLLLLLAIAACIPVDLTGTGLCLYSEGCAPNGGNGNGITYVPEQVLVNSGGVLVPDTVTLRVRPDSTQQPAVDWVNHDTLTHHFVSDIAWFDSGDISPNSGVEMGVPRVGRFTYHCVHHPWMVGTIVVP